MWISYRYELQGLISCYYHFAHRYGYDARTDVDLLAAVDRWIKLVLRIFKSMSIWDPTCTFDCAWNTELLNWSPAELPISVRAFEG